MGAPRARGLARAPHLLAASLALVVALFAFSAATARASITLVGETHSNTGLGASTITVNKPAGVQPGDVLAIGLNAGGGSIAAPAGWTVTWSSVAAYGYAIAAVKVAGSSEPSSYTFDLGSSRRATAGLTAWHGVEASTAGTNTKGFGWFFNSSSALTPSTTTTTANNVILSGVTWTGAVTSTIPAGTTLLHTVQTAGGGSGVLTTQVAYSMQAAAGSVGSKTFTSSGSTSYGTLTDNFEPDITPPAAPSITSSPATPANDRNPSWSFTDEAYATFQCRLDSGSTVISGWGSCTSPKSYSLFAQPDGVYTLSVKATDAAGNTGPTATSNYTLDTTPPAAPAIDSAPASPGSSRSPAWSFSDEAGATFQCQLNSGGTVVSAWSSCTSGQAFDVTGQPDGTYTLSVKATDQAGNTGSVSTSAYVLDTAAPAAPTITGAPGSPGTTRSPAWSFTDEAGATFQCQLAQGATVVSAWSSCTSGQSFDLTGQPDGAYTLSVKATDTAGNTGAVSTSSYALDTSAPAAPTITSAPSSPGATRSPAWSFSGEAGATYACQIDRSGSVISTWSSCTSGQSFSLFAQADGVYTFSVRATDQAGNTGSAATSSYTLDTTAPAAPTIDSAPVSPSNSRSAAWSFSDEAGATFQCQLDRGGTVVSSWAPCTSGQAFDLTGQPDGAYTFSVRAIDQAANTGSAATSTYTLDTTAPSAPTITSAPGSPGSGDHPMWSFAAESGAGFRCQLVRGGTVVYAWTACTSGRQWDLSGAPDGTYALSVTATDQAGNESAAATSSYDYDRTPPAAPTITSSPGTSGTSLNPAWSFSGDAGATFECRLDRGGSVVSDWTSCPSPQSYDLSAQPDGTYTFSVRARDAAGNRGTAATSDYAMSTSRPPAPTIDAPPSTPGNSTAPSWGFSSAEAGDAFRCQLLHGGTVEVGWAACTSPQSYDLSGQPDGTYTLEVEARNGLGTTGPSTTSDYVLDTLAPSTPTIGSSPASPRPNRSPAWAFSSDPDASFDCKLTRSGAIVSDWAACTSGQAFDLTGQPDGLYTLTVRARDAAGNTSGTASSDFTLDSTAPAVPSIVSSPGAISANVGPVWGFTAEPGAALECLLSRGVTTVSDWSACGSPRGYSLIGQPDGDYSFEVRATDAAGNVSAPAVSAYQLLAALPGMPAITSAPAPLGNDRSPAWAFTVAAGSTAECRIERGQTAISDWSPCATARTYDLSGQPDGQYTFSLRARNAAATVSDTVGSTYVLDTTPPAAPKIESRPDSSGTDRTPRWTFSGEDGASFECRLKPFADWSSCAKAKSYDLTGEQSGNYTFAVRATDRAGNTGAAATDDYTFHASSAPGGAATPAPPAPGSQNPPAGNPPAPSPGSTPGSPQRPTTPSANANPSHSRAKPPAHDAVARGANTLRRALRGVVPSARRRARAAAGTSSSHHKTVHHHQGALASVTQSVAKAARVVAKNADKAVFPGFLIFIVAGFLSIQGRIDRNDPKLALAPTYADPDLDFGPPPGDE